MACVCEERESRESRVCVVCVRRGGGVVCSVCVRSEERVCVCVL